MQEDCQALLAGAGYRQYEVSAYAREGFRCRHNENYWRFGNYLGIGAGAHGKLTDASGNIARIWKVRHPARYLESAGACGKALPKPSLPSGPAWPCRRWSRGFRIASMRTCWNVAKAPSAAPAKAGIFLDTS